ncbi:MAG: nucleoside deaminase [Verrucomicrobiota bacterium]
MLIECPFPKKYPNELQRDETYFMSMAYNQAIEAWKRDEVPIGAVIEFEGRVIASAYNQVEGLKDPTAHAEVLAITKAAQVMDDWRLNGATLYVTKEPCPMCSGACVMARLSAVVYAVRDPKMGCLGGAASIHKIETLNHQVEVRYGVMDYACKELLQTFFQLKRNQQNHSVAGTNGQDELDKKLWN